MYVVATAGHVDHGKSTLVRALTGQDPDRLEEEHRRGLSIELGYCWTTLRPAGDVAFVDVPGHERFVTTMLAGAGPAPATLLVVAADDDWMPQAGEHVAALDALGVRYGVLAVTRSDLADPGPALARARAALAGTSLAAIPAVPVIAPTGAGLEKLRTTLADALRRLPEPDPDGDVRLWVDRVFSVPGAGMVVTGTLPAGRIRVGDALEVRAGERPTEVRVRGLQSLGREADDVSGTARVAVRLGGRLPQLSRGAALVTPGAWPASRTVDARVVVGAGRDVPRQPVMHVGATSVGVRTRPLDGPAAEGGVLVRLTLDAPLPLRVGDRVLLRDPGSRDVWGCTVLDPDPPALQRRGAARRRAELLAPSTGAPDVVDEVRRRTVVDVATLRRLGVDDLSSTSLVRVGNWLLDRAAIEPLRQALAQLVQRSEQERPAEGGVTAAAAARQLHLPDPALIAPLVTAPLEYAEGKVRTAGARRLPATVEDSLTRLEQQLSSSPYAAPDAATMATLGLDVPAVAAAAKAGRLLRLAESVVLLPGADRAAARRLRELPQPFTTSEARQALGTSRRVVLPLLAHLDRIGLTRRLPDDRRTVTDRS